MQYERIRNMKYKTCKQYVIRNSQTLVHCYLSYIKTTMAQTVVVAIPCYIVCRHFICTRDIFISDHTCTSRSTPKVSSRVALWAYTCRIQSHEGWNNIMFVFKQNKCFPPKTKIAVRGVTLAQDFFFWKCMQVTLMCTCISSIKKIINPQNKLAVRGVTCAYTCKIPSHEGWVYM